MDIKSELDALNLKPDHAIVIGSGILNALDLRKSNDIDVVVTPKKYERLRALNQFEQVIKHERETLIGKELEIATSWTVLGRTRRFDDLLAHTGVIDGVRYITVDFLLDAKQHWIANGEGRPKDVDDVMLMEVYLQS